MTVNQNSLLLPRVIPFGNGWNNTLSKYHHVVKWIWCLEGIFATQLRGYVWAHFRLAAGARHRDGCQWPFCTIFFAGWIETIWDVFKVFIYINLVNEFILELFLCVNQSDLNPFQRFSITHWIPNIRAKVERLILRSLGFTSRFVFFFLIGIPKKGVLKTREFLQKDPRNSLWILVGKRESSLPKTWVLLLMVQKSGTTVDNR